MGQSLEYKQQINYDNKNKAKEILKKLPIYCEAYFASILNKSGGTIFLYISNIYEFFEWLVQTNPIFKQKGLKNITIEDLALLTRNDIYEFLNSRYNSKHGVENEISQAASTKRICLSALNSFFNYWVDEGDLEVNVIERIDRKQFATERRRRVIRLDDEEKDGLLDAIKYGCEGLTDKQNAARQKTAIRDYAICLTLLRTGIRVSELVGLNIGDINFKKNNFVVARKKSKHKDDLVFFDDDVATALLDYLGEKARPSAVPPETPVFTVSQGKYKGNRLSVRSVENLVYKYSRAGAGRKVSPHKLRATFATDMIAATGNIDLVKEQLGHMNIQTTTIYIDDAVLAKEKARNILKERKEKLENGEDVEVVKRKL